MVSMLMIFLVVQPVLCQYVTTLAGNGTGSFADGPALNAMFSRPECLVLDPIGNIYVADIQNNRIRKLSTSGYVSTVAGNGTTSYADGPGTTAMFNVVNGITLDPLGNLFVTDFGNHRIRKVNSSGYVSTFAGSIQGWNDGQGVSAQFYSPERITIDSQGNLFVADTFNSRVRKINSTGYVSTIAGSGALDYADGQGLNASFRYTTGVAVDSQGNIYVSDLLNLRIRKINSTYYVSTLAGSGASSFADGQGPSASFKNPSGLAVDSALNVYVADTDNNRIRVINSTGFVSTIAGNGSASFADGLAVNAMFNAPVGIAVDGLGNLYVGDSYNHRIRMISGSIISTTGITFSSSSTIFIPASTLAKTRITRSTSFTSTTSTLSISSTSTSETTSSTSSSSTSTTSAMSISSTSTSETTSSTSSSFTSTTSAMSISSTSTSETTSSTLSSSTSTTSAMSISSASPASSSTNTSSSSCTSLSFSSISSTTSTLSSFSKSILHSSISSPSSTSAPLNQTLSTPFYLKGMISGSIISTTGITFSSSSTIFIPASTLAKTRITSSTSSSSTSTTSTLSISSTSTSETTSSTSSSFTSTTSAMSISSTSTSETTSSTSSSSTSTTSAMSISSTSPASSSTTTSSSSCTSLSFSSISSTTSTLSSFSKSILHSSISSPSSTSAPLNQTLSTPFYLKAEFMYSAFAGFFVFLVAYVMISFNMKKGASNVRLRRRIGPPSQQFQYIR